MNRLSFSLAFAGLCALGLIAAACSGDDNTDSPPTATAVAQTASPSSPQSGTFPTAADLCAAATASGGVPVANPDLVEISGLAASRTQDVIWAHNDSGDTARVFALSSGGEALATYEVRGAEAVDWEDMAIGPGPQDGVDYLYLGDIGDNASIRPEIIVYRAPEPSYDPASSLLAVDAEALRFVYPDGAHDAETLLVDPISGDVIVITKSIVGNPSGVYRAAFPVEAASSTTLERIAEIDFAGLTPTKEIPAGSGPLPEALGRVPTGGDISPDGSVIGVRTYGTIWLWQRDGNSIASSFATPPCEAPSEVETQGEAFAFTDIGYVTASEGAGVNMHEFVPD